MILILLFFVIGCFSAPITINNLKIIIDPIPGSNLVPTSYDILRDVRMAQIFDHTYNKNRIICPHGISPCYIIPDDYNYYTLFDQSTNGRTKIIETSTDWETSYAETTTVVVSGSLFSMSASAKYSEEYKEYNKVSTEYNSVETEVYVECDEHTLTIKPGQMKLRDDFLLFSTGLPTYFDESNAYLFFQYFSIYGTAVTTSALFGGRLIGKSFSEREYYLEVDKTEITTCAEASFFLTVTKEEHYSEEISQEYESNTISVEAYTQGGNTWNPSHSYIKDWADSVQTSTALIYKKIVPIYEIFCQEISSYNQSDLLLRCDAVKEAYYVYLKVPGCTDIRSDNYNSLATMDDGSCPSSIKYTEEYLVTRDTAYDIKMLPVNNNTFCFITHGDDCATQCELVLRSDNFWWLELDAKDCTPTDIKYCGARCAYFEMADVGMKSKINISKNKNHEIYVNQYGNVHVIPENGYISGLLRKYDGYCRITSGGESCKVNINKEDDMWYGYSGNDKCEIVCYHIDFK